MTQLERGYTAPDLQKGFCFLKDIPKDNPLLRDRYVEPPFSILDTKGGYWQDRKRAWLSLNIQSELGRDLTNTSLNIDHNDVKYAYIANRGNSDGGSIFDPVLCELMYTWFCPIGGKILDPFAGGSVRGIVANYLGYKYTGIDLSSIQVEANYAQARDIIIDNIPNWVVGDSKNIDTVIDQQEHFDFIFTCPPYYNLEIYSDNPADLSRAPTYNAFLGTYELIITKSLQRLYNDRFACFVVGNFRDKEGFMVDLVGDTVSIFNKANVKLYNEAILATAIGSLPVRTSAQFKSSHKLGKCHQNVLVFYKGDPTNIKLLFSQPLSTNTPQTTQD